MDDKQEQVRIDKWLWAARFFKTRGLASKAASGGKAFLNDQRCKPSKPVAIGDMIRIHKGQVEQTVIVLAISSRRGPAKIAQTLYEETESSIATREKKKQERSLFYAGQSMPSKRPGKRDRRKIKKFVRNDE
ncbi:MAG: RNA-binding protein [Desulfocapsa sp.]|nr:RNA-binding protein [Desulfocapsa sp.]